MPNFFWDSEPTLHPLYAAIREYLEIDPRIKVLNERCRVFLDLAEILSDSVADGKMTYITWIIIVLIVISILVTVTEVALRFAMLQKSSAEGRAGQAIIVPPAPMLDGPTGMQVSGLEILARELGIEANATIDDVRRGIWELKQGNADGATTPLAEGLHTEEEELK